MSKRLATDRFMAGGGVAVFFLLCVPTGLAGQTISGTLLEASSGRPLELGIVELISVAGDTVARAFTRGGGRFEMTSEDPGSFILSAAAFGYGTTRAGVFELGAGGEMSVEVRLRVDPVELDAMLVGLNRPVLEHPLVSSGFVDRFSQGFGHFITPFEIERSSAQTTTELFRGINGVTVRPIAPGRPDLGSGSTLSYAGDRIMLQGQARWCQPTVYLDGMRYEYDADTAIDAMVPLGSISAVEIYRSPAEVPVQYNATRSQDLCGVILFWTKKR